MVVHNPNNWHWVDKNCLEWARKYFNENLVGLKTGDVDGKSAQIGSVSSIEGDCEVSQRKGKVISLFDLKLVMMVNGHVGDEKFEGSITVPEVAFDSEKDEYQFEVSIYKETGKLSEIKPVIKAKLLPQLRDAFSKFGPDLLSTHANDIQVPADQVNSQFTKGNLLSGETSSSSSKEKVAPAPTAAKVAASKPKVASSGVSADAPKYNTTTLHLEPTFNVPAIELYQTFLDKQRIQAWSRSILECSSSGATLEKGDEFTLFGGNVTSKLVDLEIGKRLVFEWRLNDWRKGHNSRMTMEFHESKEYHETKLQVTWSGVPIGEEDKVKGNFMEYYVRSIKLTFGFGAVL